jgi:DivIVA domain-containing protein
MRYTPVELRHVKPKRSFRGYERAEVDRLVADVADSFEEVWSERGELADKLEDVEKLLSEVKQREALLASTLVAAEKTAAAAIESAKREAEVIVAEAHQESRSVMRAAQAERERLFAESRRVETLLRAALGMVEESQHAPQPKPPQQQTDSWPNREHTREFQAVQPPEPAPAPASTPEPAKLPPVQEVAAEEPEDDGPWAARDFAWG